MDSAFIGQPPNGPRVEPPTLPNPGEGRESGVRQRRWDGYEQFGGASGSNGGPALATERLQQ